MTTVYGLKFEDLPDEIILKVVSNLETEDLFSWWKVSRRFRTITLDKSLWQKVNMSGEDIPTKVLQQIIESGCRYLSLCDSKLFGDNFRLEQPSNLIYLDLRLYHIDGVYKPNYQVIEELLSSCWSLQKLSLANLTLNFDMIKNLCLQNGSTLKILDLALCKGMFKALEW